MDDETKRMADGLDPEMRTLRGLVLGSSLIVITL